MEESSEARNEFIEVSSEAGNEFMEDVEEAPAELTLQDHILEIVDVIPMSTSVIMEQLYKRGQDISVPILVQTLSDMVYSGDIVQCGAAYRKSA